MTADAPWPPRIESHIPVILTRAIGSHQRWAFIKKMKALDSFALPGRFTQKEKDTLWNVLRYYERRYGYQFTTRQLETEYRIWRTK